MEIKRSDSAPENRNPATNVASVFENFPWTAFEQSSKGANIINVINQLLSMYHPDDGLIAYERVLKTLLVLSENLDSDLQQQIISVIPLPKGVSNDKIENLIYKITELIRSSKVSSCGETVTGSEDKRNTEEIQNILIDSSQSFELNDKFVSSVPEVFKGFPPNEISTVHSHVRNVNYMYDTLNYNVPCMKSCVDVKQNFHEQEESLKLKWFHSPHLLCETNLYQSTSAASCQQGFVKSMDDKYFQLSIDRFNNWNQYSVTNVPHALHQDATCLRKLYKNNVISGKQNKNEMTKLEATRDDKASKSETNCEILYTGNTNQSSKKYNNTNKHRVLNVEAQEFFEQELQNEQQAIQQDIYKMDVVHCEEDVINTQTLKEDDSLMDDLVPCKKLKTSLQNFLNRAKQEILIECPVLPRTKALHVATPTTKGCKFTSQRSLQSDRLSLPNDNACAFKSATESTKKLTEKKTAPRNIYSKPQRLQVLRKSLNTVLNKSQTLECENLDNAENPLYKSAAEETKRKNSNALQQTASITELATFKKQYYDTLLNIQKAKMAVANSLAMSSVESFTKYEPYYSSQFYQQQQLLEHGPRFAVHTMAHSGLSSVHNAPYTWVRYNSLRHPTMKQLRHPQQFPFQMSRNKENSVLHYVKTLDIHCFTQDESKQMKQGVQRKKLEDIVGKLREVESSNMSN